MNKHQLKERVQKHLDQDQAWIRDIAALEARLKSQLDEQRRKIHDVKIGALSIARVYVKPHHVPAFDVGGHYRTIAVGPVTQSRARRDRKARERGIVLPLL